MSDEDIQNKFYEEQGNSDVNMDSDTEEGHRAQRSMEDDAPDEEMILTEFGPLTIRAF